MIATHKLLSHTAIAPTACSLTNFFKIYANADPEFVPHKGGTKVSDAQIR